MTQCIGTCELLNGITGADPGIFDGEGGGGGGSKPGFTQYVENVLPLITSTPRQFSVIVHHIP